MPTIVYLHLQFVKQFVLLDLQSLWSLFPKLNKGVIVAISDAKKLGEALRNDEDSIIIEGSLAQKVLRIKATGKVAWAVAIGAIAVVIVSILAAPATGGTSVASNFVTVPVATSILGSATSTAITIAIVAGGVGALNKIRKYKIDKISADR